MMIMMIWKELERSQWVADSILSPAQQSPARYKPCLLTEIYPLASCQKFTSYKLATCQKYHPALPQRVAKCVALGKQPTCSQLDRQNTPTVFSDDFAQINFSFWFEAAIQFVLKNSLIQGENLEEPEQPGEYLFMKIGLVNWHKLYIPQLCKPDFLFCDCCHIFTA